jgi:hypothetical protein
MPRTCRTLLAAALVLAAPLSASAKDGWVQLFNGTDLTGWDAWLGIPNRTVTDLPIGKYPEGGYTDALGHNDIRQVFTVVKKDGKPAIRISGEIFGALTGQEEYDDFHLRLQVKWGEKKFPPRENAVRDSGILYYAVGSLGATKNKAWMRSLECQVQEHDMGDFWGVDETIVDVEAERSGEGKDQKTVYKKGAPLVAIDGSPRRAIKSLDNEKATGDWNTVEVLCLKGTCLHAVNGKVNLVLTNPRQPTPGGGTVPLVKGRLQIQSEGAEVFYRDIAVRPITEFPKGYRP